MKVLVAVMGATLALGASAAQAEAALPLSQRSLLLDDSRLPREAALDRMQQIRFAFRERPAPAGQLQGWSRGYGGYGSWDGGNDSDGLERRSTGLLVGVDRPLTGMWMAGALAGVSRSELQADEGGDSDVDSYHLAAYATTRYYQLGFKLGAAYSWHELDSQRRSAGQRLRGNSQAASAQLFGEASYPLDFREFTLEPFAGLAYVHLDADSLHETGGTDALHLSGEQQDGAYLTLGWRLASAWQVRERRLVGRASLAARHGFFDDRAEAQAWQPATGQSFELSGREFERDQLRLDLSLDYQLAEQLYLGLTYAGQYADDARDNQLGARFSLQF
ncbi:autotransporter outer membrane beta-barrel domain-containing protein [Pseudomonas sp. J452]|uniref:autotransporter outer membrane beta-barrel domain-containing protein n=1 Tax=Pseudomonas sp. J452 TaxID=2898441 RepID=UPI0021ADB93B|nr:autotransporter outer membrane beta-barrel domain-containing protein [Pseudomonas sp. J452]UUY06467.1 autotransporter outer membrane beta-barrel domain-containing protein [Pseudomonas sp. J452]